MNDLYIACKYPKSRIVPLLNLLYTKSTTIETLKSFPAPPNRTVVLFDAPRCAAGLIVGDQQEGQI
jgi:hypothetical protein